MLVVCLNLLAGFETWPDKKVAPGVAAPEADPPSTEKHPGGHAAMIPHTPDENQPPTAGAR